MQQRVTRTKRPVLSEREARAPEVEKNLCWGPSWFQLNLEGSGHGCWELACSFLKERGKPEEGER